MIDVSNKRNRDISARRRQMRDKGRIPWSYALPAIIILVIIIGIVYFGFNNHVTEYQPPPVGDLDFPFQCLSSESLYLHVHPWLVITIDGKNVTIPPGIGIKNPVQEATYNGEPVYGGGANSCFEPVHTHDNSGIIHIESPTNTNYTLGNFFQIWAATYAYASFNGSQRPIVFNSTDILGYKVNSSSTSLKLIVDGQVSTQNGNLVLTTLDYCSTANSDSAPCQDTAAGNPSWDGGTAAYPYGTGHTIVIEYTS